MGKEMSEKPLSSSQRALKGSARQDLFRRTGRGGRTICESELADLLDMSRTPVREAVLTLESQGLLELRPRKGVRILPLSPEDMSDVYDVLTELESPRRGTGRTLRLWGRRTGGPCRGDRRHGCRPCKQGSGCLGTGG